ncbi:protein kinase domain-containing protein [Actinomadura miaoliensis]|uniref:Protein kinase domain-containing protein n=1 Tax=Actinomadura miaoliensis TaxID=430685 RepID=A0ABP7WCG3_9ACTN
MEAHATGSPPDDVRPLEPADPRAVGGYPLLGRIGAGGMGTVYLGCDPDSNRRVAVKTIHPHLSAQPSYRRRFRDEAVLAGRVASFCTARVLAHGEEEGRPYIVSEYVGGMSLQHRITTGGPLPPDDLHGVAVGVASALAAIHSAGLVHRDLKPANVMLTLSGCRVIDFGIARAQDSPSTVTTGGTVLGTPGWMAPEVLSGGAATPAADVFAWGCLIVYAGTGRLPFGEGQPTEVALRVMREEPDLSELPPALEPVVRAALAKDPAVRPPTADLMLTLVRQPGTPVSPVADKPGPSRASSPVPPPRRAVNGAAVAAPRPRPAQDDEGPDTEAFGLIRHVGARSTARVRVLAGAGAAVAAVLVGGLIMGLGGQDRDVTPARAPGAPLTGRPAPADPPATGRQVARTPTQRPHKALRTARPAKPPRKIAERDQDTRVTDTDVTNRNVKGKGLKAKGTGAGRGAAERDQRRP